MHDRYRLVHDPETPHHHRNELLCILLFSLHCHVFRVRNISQLSSSSSSTTIQNRNQQQFLLLSLETLSVIVKEHHIVTIIFIVVSKISFIYTIVVASSIRN